VRLTDEQRELVAEHIGLCYTCSLKFARKNAGLYQYGLDYDDLVQISHYALCKAAASFSPEKGFAFSSYFFKVCRNEFLMEIRACRAKSRRAFSESVSYDAMMDDESGLTLFDTIGSDDESPENIVLRKEVVRDLERSMDSGLNDKQRDVLMKFCAGLTQQDIAQVHGCSQSYISRVLRKSRRDLARVMAQYGHAV